jgi:hypothetical protein
MAAGRGARSRRSAGGGNEEEGRRQRRTSAGHGGRSFYGRSEKDVGKKMEKKIKRKKRKGSMDISILFTLPSMEKPFCQIFS